MRNDLQWNANTEIRCAEHAPDRGSLEWELEGWSLLLLADVRSLEACDVPIRCGWCLDSSILILEHA